MTKKRPRFEEALVGFDARQRSDDVEPLWSPSRRSQYLLRSSTKCPISVDTTAWPNVFGDGVSEEDISRLGLPYLSPPRWRGRNQGLWDDLGEMRSEVQRIGAQHVPLIAVTWFSADGFSRRSSSGAPHIDETAPLRLGQEWSRVGFDVADSYLTSGLSNCGYNESKQREEFRRRWRSRLNEYHLFDDPEDAMAFAALTDERVPEHAPFLVYGIRVADPLRRIRGRRRAAAARLRRRGS